jgi:predicted transcriptional regulator
MLVRNITSQIGENAGKIWQVITHRGVATLDEIESETNLNPNELQAAIGWLARENKIREEQDTYRLADTNLKDMIGTTAGKIYKILDIWEQADLPTMKQLSNQSDEDLYKALGWLAREDKIVIDQDRKYSLKSE